MYNQENAFILTELWEDVTFFHMLQERQVTRAVQHLYKYYDITVCFFLPVNKQEIILAECFNPGGSSVTNHNNYKAWQEDKCSKRETDLEAGRLQIIVMDGVFIYSGGV